MQQYASNDQHWHVKSGKWGKLLHRRYAQYLITIQQWLGKPAIWRITTDLIVADPLRPVRLELSKGKQDTIQLAMQRITNILPLFLTNGERGKAPF